MDQLTEELLLTVDKLKRTSPFFYASWVEAESVDANLSIIDTGLVNEITNTSQMRFVPKAESVSPSAGDRILCSSNPVVILAVVVGDISLAEV